MRKTCQYCHKSLSLDAGNFHRNKSEPDGFHRRCKPCRKTHRLENLETYLKQERASHHKHADARNAYNRSRYDNLDFAESQRAANRQWHKDNAARKREYNQNWRSENPDKVRGYLSDAYKKDPLRHIVSSHINYCLRRAGTNKAGKTTKELLGYSIEQLREHIQRQFGPEMSWDNRGTVWELDHIVPLTSFNIKSHRDADFKSAWALSNLMPLAKAKNRSKGGKRLYLI